MEAGRKVGRVKVVRAAVQSLESLSRAGVKHLPKGKALRTGAKPSVPPKATPPDADDVEANPRTTALDALRRKVARCTKCAELVANRTQTVFGVGNQTPRLVFLGEAPGADEDRQGEPFVGRAGQLLDDIITKGMKLKREDVYILNVLKCRPPENRTPEPEEAANCRPFLDAQLEILKPEFICCLGAVAAKSLLRSEQSIGQLRGQVYRYGEIRVICTYHPAYLLRNPSAKRETWKDIQQLMAEMGLPTS
jgi:uracil-DNA glycosylase